MPQLDAEEFLHWEARQDAKFELHDGFIVAFAGGTLDHDQISFALRLALDRLFPAPCRTFGSDVKIRVAEATFYYADAGVICEDTAPDASTIGAPRLVAEVLSPSTRAYDLIEKRAAYRAMPSVDWYIIVHTSLRRIEVDARGGAAGWATEVFDEGDAYIGDRVLRIGEIYARSSLDLKT